MTLFTRMMVSAGLMVGTASAAVAQSVDYLALQEIMGEPVTTSVTGKPQRASELPASTIIITREEIARSPARDVPGLLKSHAGIDVNRWTAGQSDVAVRGGVQTYNARLLVLVNGRQVYLDHYGMTNWNLLGVQIGDIQQIELVRGPASALFGFNAADGVVNIVTTETDAASVRATAEVGNRGYSRLGGVVSLPVTPDINAKLTAGRQREDERDIPASLLGPSAISDVAADQLSGSITARPDGRTRLTLDGGYSTNRQVEYLPSQLLSLQRFRSGNTGANAERDTDWGGLSLGGYVNWLDARYGLAGPSGQGSGPGSTTSDLDNRTIVGHASALVRVGGNNTLRAGAEYRNNRLRSNILYSDEIHYDVGSANMMLEIHPGDAVTVTAAGRVDRLWLGQSGTIAQPAVDLPESFDRAFTRVSFNAAILVQTDADGQFRLNGGRGYQLPSLVNYGLRLPLALGQSPLPVLIAGDPQIQPVTVWSGEAGYQRTLGNARVDATAFVTKTEGAIATPGDGLAVEFRPGPLPVLFSRLRAVGDFTAYGIELTASGSHRQVRWRANYSWTDTDEDLPSLAPPIQYPLSPRSTTARHKANAELGYDAGRWYVTAVGRYTSSTRQFTFNAVPQLVLARVDDAVAVDAKAAFRLRPELHLYVAGENLTAASGAAGSPIPADRRLRAGMAVSF